MKTTKKLLSIVLAAIMILGCCGISSFAIDLPRDLAAGTVTVRGLSTLSGIEIVVDQKFTQVADDAEFTVYYSEKPIADDIFNLLGIEKAGMVYAENAYIAGGALHIGLSSLKLSNEGYYYISIPTGALTGDGCYNLLGVTDGAEYQFASLGLIEKLTTVIDYIFSVITNLLSNGKPY